MSSSTPPSSGRFLPSRIGRYTVLAEIGRGGMGRVYRARDLSLGRDVAIKLIHADRLSDVQLERFRREARVLAQIEHPGVVRLHDFDLYQGRPYLVMDLVEGESLAERLQRLGALRPTAGAELVLTLTQTLVQLHAQGILHRDLKPDNVLVDGSGQPRLTDFGLAKALDGVADGLSKTGQFLGTPGYWPPEQARGERERVGPASDVYGLGAILYACLTGRAPVTASSLTEFLIASWKKAEAPSRLSPAVDPVLDAICLRCLEADPEDRWPSATALAEALGHYLEGGDAPPPRGRGRGLAAGVLAVLGVLGAALGVVVWQGDPQVAPTSETPLASGAPRTPEPPEAASSPPQPVTERVEIELARGRAAYVAGDHAGAIESFDAAISLDPTRAEAFGHRGASRWQLGDEEGALRDFDRSIALDPTDAKAWINRAACRLERGDLAGSRVDFEGALKADPSLAVIWRDLGVVCDRLGDGESALEAFTRAIELDPEDWGSLHSRGVLQHNLGQTQLAAEGYAAALEAGTRLPKETLRILGDLIDALTELDDTVALELALTRQIELLPSDSAYTARASARFALGRDDEALVDLDRALEFDPCGTNYRNRGVSRARLGDHEGALVDLNEALALEPEVVDVWLARGSVHVDLGDLPAALLDFQRALELDPSQGRTWRGRGLTRKFLGRLWPALADLEQAARLPAASDYRFERGELRWALGDAIGALEDMEATLAGSPADPEAWATRAMAHQRLGHYQQALSDSQETRRRGRTGAARQIARVHALLGDRERALEVLRGELADRPDALYAALWLAGLGGEREPLERFVDGQAWINAVARHYARGGDPQELLARARVAETELERREQLCEANVYLGLEAELRGERELALELYRAAVGTEVLEFVEYCWAWRRLLDMSAGSDRSEAYQIALDHGEARLAAGAMQEARQAFDEAIALQPGEPLGYLSRASCRFALGDLAGAFLDSTRAIELSRYDPAPWATRALGRIAGGDYAGAEGDLIRALALGPNPGAATKARRLLADCQARIRKQTGAAAD